MTKKLCFVFAAATAVPLLYSDKRRSRKRLLVHQRIRLPQAQKVSYSFVSNAVIGAAGKMPEENYSFKPTPDVRSFGQLVGHVADASYMFCSQASGEANPMKNIEKTRTSKADLVAAVKDAVAYCNKTFDSMTDAKGSQMVKLFDFQIANLTVLSLNTAHTDEHYGNMVTYLRLKEIVPPTRAKMTRNVVVPEI